MTATESCEEHLQEGEAHGSTRELGVEESPPRWYCDPGSKNTGSAESNHTKQSKSQNEVVGRRRRSVVVALPSPLSSRASPPPPPALPTPQYLPIPHSPTLPPLRRPSSAMVKIRTNRTKPPPEGFEDIESILDEYNRKMRDGPSLPLPARGTTDSPLATAESESHEGKRKNESLWPIMRITHTRSRYIYDLYYKREAISKELYDWLLDQEYADAKCVVSHSLSRGEGS